MNESEENKELIQRIAETLRNHAEPYKEGAWERFSTTHGTFRKRVVWWPYGSAAAVLLVAAAALFLSNPEGDVPAVVRIESETEQTRPPGLEEPKQVTTPALTDNKADKVEELPRLASNQTRPAITVAAVVQAAETVGDNAPVEHISAEPISDEENSAGSEAVAGIEAEDEAPDNPPQRLALVDQPAASEVPVGAVGQEQNDAVTRKWNLGIAVAPSMTSEKLNLGGGIAVAYQLSDKFSVGSGVSIGRLGMAENPDYNPSSGNPPKMSDPNTGGEFVQGFADNREQYKRDISLTSNVVALDIPLDLRYEVFKGFYTSVGVSYVAVLSEERTEHFIGGLNETTFGSDKMAGKNLIESTTVGYRSEKMATQPLKGKGYAGFMNFSIGRKMSLSKHVFFSIEPYFKLPIGQLSKEQMDFTNGGIRIVTGF